MSIHIPPLFRYQPEVLPLREAGETGLSAKQLKTESKAQHEGQCRETRSCQYLGTGRSVGEDARSNQARRRPSAIGRSRRLRLRLRRGRPHRHQLEQVETLHRPLGIGNRLPNLLD